MNPHPPVTKMRIAAPNNSEASFAPVDSRTVPERIEAWRARAAEMDWTPWLIVGLGAFLRLFLLGIKPPHFDEGINGWFVDQMMKNGFYKYDPTNYHGPLHFYILFLSLTLFGRNLWALRLPVVLGSIFTVGFALKFERLVGREVSRLAALAMAVSPGFVFYGRYSIHEVWLLLFSMMFVFGLVGLWKFGTRAYLWYFGIGLTGMILTKETYIMHVGCALITIFITWLSHKITPGAEIKPAVQTWSMLDLLVLCLTSIGAIIFFYSGTFFNWPGVTGLYETFKAWAKTGKNGNGHEKAWYYWLMLIGRYELPIAIGLLACLCCQFYKNLAVRFIAIMGVGTLIAYSIVRYKTPWCIISITWPFAFLFGATFLLIPLRYRKAASVGYAIVLAISLVLCVRLNYFRCTTDTEPYVYVQTYNDVDKLTEPILRLAKHNPAYYQLTGHIIRPSAYPLPWILGDFPKVGYYEQNNKPANFDADFLLVQEERVKEVEGQLHGEYFTAPLTIRPYQDPSKLYLKAKVFQPLFPNRTPEFVGPKKS